MTYQVIITDKDPTLEGARELMRIGPQHTKTDAYSDCRHYAKLHRGFGAVYAEDGESLFEIDFTYQDTAKGTNV